MANTTGKAKKSKGGSKKSDLLAKPKRPMSAYNFFFKAERAKILADSEGDDGGVATSFEDIGRTIGQRWVSLSYSSRALGIHAVLLVYGFV